jgi:hypothetical protein
VSYPTIRIHAIHTQVHRSIHPYTQTHILAETIFKSKGDHMRINARINLANTACLPLCPSLSMLLPHPCIFLTGPSPNSALLSDCHLTPIRSICKNKKRAVVICQTMSRCPFPLLHQWIPEIYQYNRVFIQSKPSNQNKKKSLSGIRQGSDLLLTRALMTSHNTQAERVEPAE